MKVTHVYIIVCLFTEKSSQATQKQTDVDKETQALLTEAAGTMDSRLLENILDKLKSSVRDFLTKQQTPKVFKNHYLSIAN
jgi:hypothetical protein